MLPTDQPKPDLGSQSGTVATNPDGTTDIYFGPAAPDWFQTSPGKGWFTVPRFYNPMPSFFDKTWRPGEIEPSRPTGSQTVEAILDGRMNDQKTC
jgi:hypothetical protein